jgi:hypothetical protein
LDQADSGFLERLKLAQRVNVVVYPGAGKNLRTVDIRDAGIGIQPAHFKDTILSLNEGNKISKHYLAGAYGQRGSSTFVSRSLTLIASRSADSDLVGFTLVRIQDLDPSIYKVWNYVYLEIDGAIPEAPITLGAFEQGTLVRHFGYDLSNYSSNFGERSVYGLLNKVLFDPVNPVFLENRKLKTIQRRTIKGARNALNGAIDEGDEDQTKEEVSARYQQKMFHVPIEDYGTIGIEYWLLAPPKKDNKYPTAAFVNPNRPIVLTLLGQNQGELSIGLIRKDADLPYLALRLIGHIDCNSLNPAARRTLFVANREDARRGALYDRIRDEFVKALRSDDELRRRNEEAKAHLASEQDSAAKERLRNEVAKLLRLPGLAVTEQVSGSPTREGTGEKGTRRRQGGAPRDLIPIIERESPTFVRIVWPEEKAIEIYPSQRRYIRVETDAAPKYHDPTDPKRSRFNVVLAGLVSRGTTALLGGRMRLIVDAPPDAKVGTGGLVRLELSVPGLPTIADQRDVSIVKPPDGNEKQHRPPVPDFDVKEIKTLDEATEAGLPWTNLQDEATAARMETQTLMIFFSAHFPAYAERRASYEGKDVTLAASFTNRYKTWLAAHSLLHYQDRLLAPVNELSEELADEVESAERRRFSKVAAMFAAREVDSLPDPRQGD